MHVKRLHSCNSQALRSCLGWGELQRQIYHFKYFQQSPFLLSCQNSSIFGQNFAGGKPLKLIVSITQIALFGFQFQPFIKAKLSWR